MKNSRKHLPVLWSEDIAPQPLNFIRLAPSALPPREWDSLEAFRKDFTEKLAIELNGKLPSALFDRAMADAWSLAALTPFPRLFLPALADEKIAEATVWFVRQSQLREPSAISFAA